MINDFITSIATNGVLGGTYNSVSGIFSNGNLSGNNNNSTNPFALVALLSSVGITAGVNSDDINATVLAMSGQDISAYTQVVDNVQHMDGRQAVDTAFDVMDGASKALVEVLRDGAGEVKEVILHRAEESKQQQGDLMKK